MKKTFTKIIVRLTAALLSLSLCACSSAESTENTKDKNISVNDTEEKEHIVVTDSIGRDVEIPYPVTKAVVANAYNTEIINAVGALDCVVGVDYNIYQDKESWKNRFTEDMVIGKSQKDLNYEKIIELQPEVLILTGNGTWEEAEKQLEPFGIKVIVCNAYYTNEFEKSCDILGKVFAKEEKSEELKNASAVQVESEAVVEANPEYIIKVSAPDVYSSYYPPTQEEHKAIKEEIMSRPGWDEIDAVKNDNILLLSHYVHGGASKLVGTMYIAKFLYPEQLSELHPETVFRDWLEEFQKLDYIEGHTYPEFSFED